MKRTASQADLEDLFPKSALKLTSRSIIKPPTLGTLEKTQEWRHKYLRLLALTRGEKPPDLPKITPIDVSFHASPISNSSVLQTLRRSVLGIVKPNVRHYKKWDLERLPGPLPVTMTGRKLALLRKNPDNYWVCEKTDGIRFMLYIRKGDCYLINRKFEFSRLKNAAYSRFLGVADSRGGDNETLLDGEIVTSLVHDPPRLEYYCYDSIYVQGQDMLQRKLSERLKLAKRVIKKWDDHASSPPGLDLGKMINLRTKIFEQANKVGNIFSKITGPVDGHYTYCRTDETGKVVQKNLNDGIIYTPEEGGYAPRDKGMLFKWKWFDHQTIDLKMKWPPTGPKRNKIKLYCGIENDKDAPWGKPVELTPEQLKHTTALIEEAKQDQSWRDCAIVECRYDVPTGNWTPRNLRLDKRRANFSTTCSSTVFTMIDNITPEQLQSIGGHR